jgi:hypothetical protein
MLQAVGTSDTALRAMAGTKEDLLAKFLGEFVTALFMNVG